MGNNFFQIGHSSAGMRRCIQSDYQTRPSDITELTRSDYDLGAYLLERDFDLIGIDQQERKF